MKLRIRKKKVNRLKRLIARQQKTIFRAEEVQFLVSKKTKEEESNNDGGD